MTTKMTESFRKTLSFALRKKEEHTRYGTLPFKTSQPQLEMKLKTNSSYHPTQHPHHHHRHNSKCEVGDKRVMKEKKPSCHPSEFRKSRLFWYHIIRPREFHRLLRHRS
jgi:hypothetical protein